MATLIYRWTATFETKVEVDDPTCVDEVRDRGSDINIPEDDATTYQTDTWEIESVKTEDGKEVPH